MEILKQHLSEVLSQEDYAEVEKELDKVMESGQEYVDNPDLIECFYWGDSPQGMAYWQSVWRASNKAKPEKAV